MFDIKPKNRLGKGRSKSGAQLAEFGPALIILVGVVLVPLLDFTIVPVRWLLAHELIEDYARRLALCETFSESRSVLNADPSLKVRLEHLGGVFLKDLSLNLRISRVFKDNHKD